MNWIAAHCCALLGERSVMSIYEPVEKLLDEVIKDFKDEFQRAQITVDERSVLEPYDMNRLLQSNAKAQAALTVEALIKDAVELDRSKLIKQVENLMNEAMKVGGYSVSSFYEKILQVLNSMNLADLLTPPTVESKSLGQSADVERPAEGSIVTPIVPNNSSEITYHSDGIHAALVSAAPLVKPSNLVETELLELFNAHKNYAILTNRSGPTGIGKTFEDLMGKKEDNLSLPDFQGLIELKARDMESSSMINLFTKSPDYLPASAASFLDYKVNSYLLRNYGYIGEKGEQRLCATLSAKKAVYPKGGKYGFSLEIDDANKFIHIVVIDRETGKEVFKDAGWTYEMLLDTTKKKLQSLALISAQKKIIEGNTYYVYRHLDMIDGLDNAGLIDMIKQDIVRIDLRMKMREDDTVRDHGTGFRIRNKNLISVYKTRRLA
jgi:hypothetical protein